MLSEVMRRLGDDDDVDQVVEELEKADRPISDRLAMGTWWAPVPALEAGEDRTGHRVRPNPFDLRRIAGLHGNPVSLSINP